MRIIKKALLALIVIGCGGYGSLIFIFGLVFRVEPTEINASRLIDVFIGLIIGIAMLSFFHLVEFPKSRPKRRKVSFVAGVTVCVLSSSILIMWENLQLDTRRRSSREAIEKIEKPPGSEAKATNAEESGSRSENRH